MGQANFAVKPLRYNFILKVQKHKYRANFCKIKSQGRLKQDRGHLIAERQGASFISSHSSIIF